MNHIRGLFRPSPSTRVTGHPSVAAENRTSSSGPPTERRSHTSPKPPRQQRDSPTAGDGAPHSGQHGGSSTSSVVSATALDHLYENYRDNVTASELKGQSGERRPCMVVREYNDDLITPTIARDAIFLPREYNIIGDNTEDVLSGSEGMSELLTRTQGTAALKVSPTNSAAGVTSLNTTVMLDTRDSSGEVGNVYGESVGGAAAQSSLTPLTTSTVMALGGAVETAAEARKDARTWRTADPRSERLRKKAKVVRTARQVTPPGPVSPSAGAMTDTHKPSNNDGAGDTFPSDAHNPSQLRRFSASSWSFMEEEARLPGQMCRVVVPPTTTTTTTTNDCTDGDAAFDGSPGWQPSEVAVVRLNEALFTPSELARWRHYQLARMDSFMSAANETGTPSTSTRSREAPSSNSASGPEFMPMLGAANESSATSTRSWEGAEDEAGASGTMLPTKRRLVRVCCAEGAAEDAPRDDALTTTTSPQGTQGFARPSAVAVAASTTCVSTPQHATEAEDRLDEHRIASSRSASTCSSSSSGTSGSRSRGSVSDTDEEDTFHRDAGSATSSTASRSPSVESLDREDTGTATTSTTSEVVQLPDIFEKTHTSPRTEVKSAATAHRNAHRAGGGSAPLSCTESQPGTSGELYPLPPVARPKGAPVFHRRVHR